MFHLVYIQWVQVICTVHVYSEELEKRFVEEAKGETTHRKSQAMWEGRRTECNFSTEVRFSQRVSHAGQQKAPGWNNFTLILRNEHWKEDPHVCLEKPNEVMLGLTHCNVGSEFDGMFKQGRMVGSVVRASERLWFHWHLKKGAGRWIPLLPVNLGKKKQAHSKVLMIERFLQGAGTHGRDFRGGNAIRSERQKNTCKYCICSDGNKFL